MKTSIIVLTHNRSSLLEKCLDSLLSQTRPSDEVIVVNNNSSREETKKIMALIRKHKENVRYLFNKTNSIPRGRNKGIKNAQKGSKIIAFIDDDCLANKDWLENIKKEHQAHREWQAIQGKVVSIPKDNLYARMTGITYQNWLRSNLLEKNLLSIIDTKNVSFKAKVFSLSLRFNEKFEKSSDIELGLRLRKKSFKIGHSPKIIVKHLERTGIIPFLHQHLNIAQGESKTNIKLLPSRYKYHLSPFAQLAWQLIKEKAFLSLLILLFLLPIILILRMVVFLSRP